MRATRTTGTGETVRAASLESRGVRWGSVLSSPSLRPAYISTTEGPSEEFEKSWENLLDRLAQHVLAKDRAERNPSPPPPPRSGEGEQTFSPSPLRGGGRGEGLLIASHGNGLNWSRRNSMTKNSACNPTWPFFTGHTFQVSVVAPLIQTEIVLPFAVISNVFHSPGG